MSGVPEWYFPDRVAGPECLRTSARRVPVVEQPVGRRTRRLLGRRHAVPSLPCSSSTLHWRVAPLAEDSLAVFRVLKKSRTIEIEYSKLLTKRRYFHVFKISRRVQNGQTANTESMLFIGDERKRRKFRINKRRFGNVKLLNYRAVFPRLQEIKKSAEWPNS